MKPTLFCLLFSLQLTAQSLPDSTTSKIDSIFKMYTAATPGVAVAVVKNSSVVFQKGYGLANMEYKIPIEPTTIFHIASESKQYVAFSALLLEQEGKLSLDDDIRKHLDYLPDFGHTITIRHLILHTSGLRDQWQLLANAGLQLDDVITQEHVLKLIARQKRLNFKPGDEWLYCNTGYTLLAEIVKKCSGQSLREFTRQRIFAPLEMHQTHFHDNYTELVPNRAYSYNPAANNTYQHAVLSYSIVGATSLFTTVLDEAKWLNNYTSGKVGGAALIEKMHQLGVLNDGRQLTYASGLVIGEFKGWKQVSHGGADAGYRTFAARYPEKDLGIIVFSNLGSANVGRLTNLIAELLITDTKPANKPAPAAFTDTLLFNHLKGKFYTERGDLAELLHQKGKLFVRLGTAGLPQELKLEAPVNNRYKLNSGGTLVVAGTPSARARIDSFQIINPNNIQQFKRMPASLPAVTSDFAGRYYSEELESFYTISFKDDKLQLEHIRFPTASLTPVAPDQFTSSHWWISHIRFVRNKQRQVIAFEVNAGRVQRLTSTKMR